MTRRPATTAQIAALQERAAYAFPAAVVTRLDGWWLRYADGANWWASSVLPHADVRPVDIGSRIRAAERFYAGHAARPRFQISPAGPDGLDGALAERGYRRERSMSLQTAMTVRVMDQLSGDEREVRVADRPSDDWFAAWMAVHGGADGPGPEWEMLRRIQRPSGYATALMAAGAVAIGRVVVDDGWAGVFGMATLPAARGRGAARGVLAALARWAAELGADQIYLQVGVDNASAQRLYQRAGFTELCRYHYRTGSLSQGPLPQQDDAAKSDPGGEEAADGRYHEQPSAAAYEGRDVHTGSHPEQRGAERD
jgi:ribosomal protein S18 acetylase RimI-like enzyme